jgi:putative tryptophan/tyrosine transport system substrate-binding protein
MCFDQLSRRNLTMLLVGAAAWPCAVRGQPTANPRVVFLGAESLATNHHFLDAFRQGMKEHGYIDGQNVTILDGWAEGRSERFPELIAGLIGSKTDAMLAVSLPAALSAKNATNTVPIVFIAGDPLETGLVPSLARPGGNLTGLSLFLSAEFSSKWLELLKEAVPNAMRVGVLWNPVNPASSHYLSVLRAAAQKLGVMLEPIAVTDPTQFDSAFATLGTGSADALVVVVDPLTFRYRERVIELALNARLPAIYGFREFAQAGGLMAYGASVADLCRRAAVYVNKILKGAKPGDLPVEQPTKFELVINTKTAKVLGLTIPSTLFAFADEVIE